MAFEAFHHAALVVDDLPEAESFYRTLFEMDVLFREGTRDDEYGKVPDDLDWETAVDDGVEPGMSFLRNGALSLALAEDEDEGAVDGGRVDHLAFQVSEADFDSLRRRVRDLDCEVDEREKTVFVTDRYGVEWELKTASPPPRCPFEVI